LIPDLVRAINTGFPLQIRSPKATRPWQHVLECLSGYLLIGQRLLEGKKEFACSWNFGPDTSSNMMVEEVLKRLIQYWPELKYHLTEGSEYHEANLLYLDSSKARMELGWRPIWNLETSLKTTAEWYKSFQKTGQIISKYQLEEYINTARNCNICWSDG
jgi:CDP-glucose 4,6-dehydratase